MEENGLKEDWLAGNAVVAAVGGLLLAQHWERTYGAYELPLLNLTIPSFGDSIVSGMVGVLIASAIAFSLASALAIFRPWGVRIAVPFSVYLWMTILLSFVITWASAMSSFSGDEWWSPVLLGIGTFMTFAFIPYRIFRSTVMAGGPVMAHMFRFPGNWNQESKVPQASSVVDSGSETLRPRGGYNLTSLVHRVRSVCAKAVTAESRSFWIAILVAVVSIEVALTIAFWDWLRGEDSASATIRNAGIVIAGSVALPLALWRALVADRQASATYRQSVTARQSLLNERYQKGAEMFGNSAPSVRLGGIYALGGLAKENPARYHVQVMSLFCEFVRQPREFSDERLADSEAVPAELPADIQAALDVIGARGDQELEVEQLAKYRLDLRRAELSSARLESANLSAVRLAWACLTRAGLGRANLTGAILNQAELTGASLGGACLKSASLRRAVLKSAVFWNSPGPLRFTTYRNALKEENILTADLSGARLDHSDLTNAHLQGANLSGADLTASDLSNANLSDANLFGTMLLGANLSGVVLGEGDEIPVTGLTQAQLDQACADPENPPILGDVAIDAATGRPLVWRGSSAKGGSHSA